MEGRRLLLEAGVPEEQIDDFAISIADAVADAVSKAGVKMIADKVLTEFQLMGLLPRRSDDTC